MLLEELKEWLDNLSPEQLKKPVVLFDTVNPQLHTSFELTTAKEYKFTRILCADDEHPIICF